MDTLQGKAPNACEEDNNALIGVISSMTIRVNTLDPASGV
jgi:hypothetical protein